MLSLTEQVLDFARSWGAAVVGVSTRETLAGGPPSVDLEYILPGARSAVSIGVPLNGEHIRAYLAKEDRRGHEQDNFRVNMEATGVAAYLARYLEQKGFPSKGVTSNDAYREEVPGGRQRMLPDLSHRYLAVRSGVGWFGFSGNVITPRYGAAVILATCVTTAELDPTAPLSPQENYCDRCGLCLAACCSALMDPKEETRVTLGGMEFTYSKRRNYLRCELVCGGPTGLPPSGKWSTWSPGRFPIPEDDGAFREIMIKGMRAYNRRPPLEGGYPHILMRSKLYLTCGNCQLLCRPDPAERKELYKLLTTSGCVIQHPDGTLERVSAEEAETHVKGLGEAERVLYV
jgi:epoxyqueuosine reductase QueG